ncbi:hypothetical protein E2562_033673 [Oryza meyeriana var. granulata]|uniref:Uncharacterized protein n=1 Tax=Oryza meyeriana var. granulata TaxID=110450 RepID=A0A6G1CA94_9ORYZ|nr:hypothetical protein E2562_033673 [Oryza meyeriana var. granulata]
MAHDYCFPSRNQSGSSIDMGMSLGHAARMFSPGARMSGLRTLGTTDFGPRDEKPTAIGACFLLVTVLQPKPNDATDERGENGGMPGSDGDEGHGVGYGIGEALV